MSVENHRHCQASITSASGIVKGEGNTWSTLIRDDFNNLPTQWKSWFLNNTGNITEDFRTVLRIINDNAGNINNSIQNLQNKIIALEGQVGSLNTGTITCYLAPKIDYYEQFTSDHSTKPLFVRHNPEEDSENRIFFTPTSNAIPGVHYKEDHAYVVGSGDSKVVRLYPGEDPVSGDSEHSNIERQYKNFGTKEQKKYPLFSLNSAMEFLRRYRSGGTVKYRVVPQFGDYEYETNGQYVRLTDASGGSELVISPLLNETERKQLPVYNGFRAGETTRYDYTATYDNDDPNGNYKEGDFKFQDADLAKVRFIWTDDISYQSTWIATIRFYDSNTTIENCAFVMRFTRSRDDYKNLSGMTCGQVLINSGKVVFTGCVFRNQKVITSNADSPPVVLFKSLYIPTNSKSDYLWTHDDFTLGNINKYQFPCVFVDDPPPPPTDPSDTYFLKQNHYMIDARSSYTVLWFYTSYVIFLARRQFIVFIDANVTMKHYFGYDFLSKMVFCMHKDFYRSADNTIKRECEQLFHNGQLTTCQYDENTSPAGSVSRDFRQRFMIDIIAKSGIKPSWIVGGSGERTHKEIEIFYGKTFDDNGTVVAGYNKDTGSYNETPKRISDMPACVRVNGQRYVNLNSDGGIGGSTYVYPIEGQAMPPITPPTKAGYRFDGYYSGSGGTGQKFYKNDGTSNQNWDSEKAPLCVLYAKWTSAT